VTRLLSFAVVLSLAACATTAPLDPPELVQARASVAAAQADPEVAARAPSELEAARSSLASAQAMAQQGDGAEMMHQAYLAEQRSRIARELAQARRHEAQIARAGEERNRVLVESRSEEKYRAAEAEAALARAKAAQEQQSVANRELAAEVQRLQAQVRELEARETQRGWVITLGSDLLFDSGRATLKPGGRRALGNVARIMRNEPERSIAIDGFTDDRGGAETNRRLSERRAQAVRRALIAAGVAPSRIVARGLGESYPVASNASPAGRQLNRRVEILIGEHAGRAATGATAPRPR
jgi:outer membrane protein OmpA-like peptidoglycan-associated protein